MKNIRIPSNPVAKDGDGHPEAERSQFSPSGGRLGIPNELQSRNDGSPAAAVTVWQEELVLPTYLPGAPDQHPMFLEKRVYQGSSGRVYPLPFTDRVAEKPVDRKWKAIWIENEFLRVLILPELGGRIHAMQDKTNGYDLIYRQHVIKPALVGLAGPWISGGIEFNWPQHHRPATFLPVDFEIEENADGNKTVWCSDHDPMARMKGMHGVCLHPGHACVELKVRVFNRTLLGQTFLWWANVATRVHEGYQSFFPPDVYYVADHARRSMSEYPQCRHFYYGINYGERARRGTPKSECPAKFVPPRCRDESKVSNLRSQIPDYSPDDLSFYANIPTPCSYMCMGSQEDFFGGYDHFAQTGIVHYANHHISPGKKQWTWGNHEFGYAWDRNLTDPDTTGDYGPYIEIMAGVYTDNQPDFSFLQPGETKTWSQYWYPIHKIGPAHHANLEAAVSLVSHSTPAAGIRLGVCVTRPFKNARVTLSTAEDRLLLTRRCDLAPGRALVEDVPLPPGAKETNLLLRICEAEGREILSYAPKPRTKGRVPPPATEPPSPADIRSTDELYQTGLHLEQYRHATRCPTLYWREALRRDSSDARCNNAMGLWHMRRGDLGLAEAHFRRAIERLTFRNANPNDGEAFYNLGLCLRFKNQPDELPIQSSDFDSAYAAFYKSTWNQAWRAAGYHALAEMDCARLNWDTALAHLNQSLVFNVENLRARNLKAIVLRKLGRGDEAAALLQENLTLDPLDWWARHLSGQPLRCDSQVLLDLAHDSARAGLYPEAIEVLEGAEQKALGVPGLPDQSLGAFPMVFYTLGWLYARAGKGSAARANYERAALEPPDYCFPARLEEIAILSAAMKASPRDARAPYYLGNLLYDRRRHTEAIRLWEQSARLDHAFSVVWRNLGIGYFNISKRPAKALAAYDKAFRANPGCARVLFERDQLWKRLGEKPARRLRELEKFPQLVRERDDLSVELCSLLNQTGRHADALALLKSRRFQPWEGGEGGPLGQHVRSHLALGRQALEHGDAAQAREHFTAALGAPENLGEAKHLLANQSDIHYWLGLALELLGERAQAREHWRAAANFKGDFQEMSVRAFSEMTYYSALSWERLGQKAKSARLLRELLVFGRKLQTAKAGIDYFATSLPTMLLFEDDLQGRQRSRALFLQAQAWLGLGKKQKAKGLLSRVLRLDPSHTLAADLQKQLAGRTAQ